MTDTEAVRVGGFAVHPDGETAARVWARDTSLWGPGEDDPGDRLGWLALPAQMAPAAPGLESFADEIASEGVADLVLIGMGGSSLAPEVFAAVPGNSGGRPRLTVGDSTHPAQIRSTTETVDLDRTLFVVSSKSGTTVETMSLYRYFRGLVADPRRFVAITDPGTPLEKLAATEGFRRCFINPPDIGGRYSALSYYGLVPAALCGVGLRDLLAAAGAMAAACGPDVEPSSNSALVLGTAMGELARAGRDKLTLLVSEPLRRFATWAEQLVAESTGKQGKGIVPVIDEPPAEPEVYGDDRAFVVLQTPGDSSLEDRTGPLEKEGHPVIYVHAGEEPALGAEMWRWEFATAVAGSVLGINPFDQPDVEAAKRAGRDALAGASEPWPAGDPDEVLTDAAPPDLVCLLAFAERNGRTEGVVTAARERILASSGVATSAGFGPRYLHSTGQLHKGGPRSVRALVVLDESPGDVPVPGSNHGFARLIAAQAEGDAEALAGVGRMTVRTTWERFESWATG